MCSLYSCITFTCSIFMQPIYLLNATCFKNHLTCLCSGALALGSSIASLSFSVFLAILLFLFFVSLSCSVFSYVSSFLLSPSLSCFLCTCLFLLHLLIVSYLRFPFVLLMLILPSVRLTIVITLFHCLVISLPHRLLASIFMLPF